MSLHASAAMEKPALLGGIPVRKRFLPLARPSLGPEEKAEVMDTLDSDWLSRGPRTARFEADFAAHMGVRAAVACASCTAGLHVVLSALGIGPGHEVITTPLTFVATLNAIRYTGALPVLADIDPGYLDISPDSVAERITPATRAIIPVHFAGQPCRMDELNALAAEHGLDVIEDAAHAHGALYKGRPAGSLARAGVFSFYASKNMTTGDGGMITTDDERLAAKAAVLCFHGISSDAWKRYAPDGKPSYRMETLGFKYNMTDIQAALGIRQLPRLEGFVSRRGELAALYERELSGLDDLRLPATRPDVRHSRHIFPVILRDRDDALDRDGLIRALKAEGVGTGVHYDMAHTHPYYQDSANARAHDLPAADSLSGRLLSLPLCPSMSDDDAMDAARAVRKVLAWRWNV